MFRDPSLLVKQILPKEKLQCFGVRLFIIFWTSKYLVLFEVNFLLKRISLLSKSVFLTTLGCFNLSTKFSAVNLLNS